MSMPNIPDMTNLPRPVWLAVRELNLSDEWRARWVDNEPIPDDTPIVSAYAVLVCDRKGYVTRAAGTPNWGVVEDVVAPNESGEQWAARACHDQAAATLARTDLIGYLDCRATTHNPTFPVGAATIRPVYLAVAESVNELGKGAAFERRRLPLNEFASAIRTRYPELHEQLSLALNRYLVLQAKGEA